MLVIAAVQSKKCNGIFMVSVFIQNSFRDVYANEAGKLDCNSIVDEFGVEPFAISSCFDGFERRSESVIEQLLVNLRRQVPRDTCYRRQSGIDD